jgi:hypothetical protein
MIDEKYREFAQSPAQNKHLDAVIKAGSNNKAAELLSVNRRSVDKVMAGIKARYDEYHGITAPDGYMVKGTSTLLGPDGQKKLQWIKTSTSSQEQIEQMRVVVEAMKEDVEPCNAVQWHKNYSNEALCNTFILTDYHLGMRAWGDETGADWDLGIAEKLLINWFAMAIELAPKADTAILAQLGDFLHWDGLEAVTPIHRNILEGDTRKDKLIEVAIKVLRKVTHMLLQTHEHVHLIMAEGNHDLDGSAWLRQLFAALYDSEPRITVDTSPQPYYCYEHGKTSIFFHHGHKRKPNNIDTVFAAKFREVFGRTEHSFGHMGHLHNNKVVESNLMEIEQHRTLASPDSYATRGGWVSGRSAKVITYHEEYGEVGRLSITPEMVS